LDDGPLKIQKKKEKSLQTQAQEDVEKLTCEVTEGKIEKV
jgi:hypothetical protein